MAARVFRANSISGLCRHEIRVNRIGQKDVRKRSNKLDGPRGSLRRLRSQLAEDGCPESQVVLAKQLLDEKCDLDVEREENARLGVYWLIKSSEQGNLEATNILKQCLETGQGVNEQNYLDVKSCLNMSQDEKVARRAAREMFSSLSAGQDYITTDQLQRRMLNTDRNRDDPGPSQQKSLQGAGDNTENEASNQNCENIREDWMSRGDYAGEKLTEEHLVSAAVSYSRGELPLVHRVLTLSEPHRRDLESWQFLQRTLWHPILTARMLFSGLVETLAKKGGAFFQLLLPTALSHVQTLLALFVYSLLGSESLLLFVPMALYYGSFCVMVISTFQMLHRHREFTDFRNWSGLFLSYSGGNLNPEEAEYQYCKNKLRPYGHFFLALLINLMVYPLIAPQWTPQSELTVLAFSLTFLTLYAFMDARRSPDALALFSLAVHVLAKYPYETDAVVRQGWRFLDVRVPTFASYVVGNGVEFCLNFRAVFYLLIPAVFVRIASRDNWRGIYKTLIPHCVTLAWWQVAVISSQGATWYGLIRGALALVGLVLFLPLAGLATVLLPVAALGNYLRDSEYATLALLATLPLLALSRCLDKTLAARVRVVLGLVAALSLLLPGPPDPYPDKVALSWEQYRNHCHQPAWEPASVAVVQLQCSHLAGVGVNWDGYVTEVRVNSVSNPLRDLVDRLPAGAGQALACFYGERYEAQCDRETMADLDYRRCRLLKSLEIKHARCHLDTWNRYEFEVGVKMKSGMWGKGAEVSLIAEDTFRNFTLALRPGDRIWFAGQLLNRGQGDQLLGGANPQIDLEVIGCLGCHKSELQIHKRTLVRNGANVLSFMYIGVKSVLNFLFNPLVIFK